MQPLNQVLDLIKSVARAMLRHPIIVIVCVVLGVGGAAGFVASRGPLYTASMSLQAADEPAGRANEIRLNVPVLSALSGPLPAYMSLLRSRVVAQRLMDDAHYDRVLFAGQVDPTTGLWKPRGLSIGGLLDQLFGIARAPRPTVDDVQRRLHDLLVVERDQLSGIATVTCTAPDPAFCVKLLADAHRETEASLRQIRLGQALQARDYANKALATATDPGIRMALGTMLAGADGVIVAAQAPIPAGAILFEPPAVAAEPIYPRPGFVLGVGLLLGLAAGAALAWWRGPRA